MNNNLYGLNYQIEELNRQKESLKKELIENKLDEITKLIITENNRNPLNERELKNILKALSYDLKDIITS